MARACHPLVCVPGAVASLNAHHEGRPAATHRRQRNRGPGRWGHLSKVTQPRQVCLGFRQIKQQARVLEPFRKSEVQSQAHGSA